MQIAYIHQYFSTPVGSGGIRTYEFARRWVEAGHKVTVITTCVRLTNKELKQAEILKKGIKKLSLEGIDIIAIEVPYDSNMGVVRRGLSFLQFCWRSSCVLIRLKKIDIVFATSTPLTVAIPALVNKFFRKVAFVFEVRDLWPKNLIANGIIKNKLLVTTSLWFEKYIYKKAAGIVALSPNMKEYIDQITEKPDKTITVPNCADIELFKPIGDEEKRKIKLRFGWENKFVIMHTGAIGKVNGLDRIVKVASRIQNHPQIHFVFIGNGREKVSVEKLVSEENLCNVMFMNPIPKLELAKILPAANIGLVSIHKMPHSEFNSANKFFDYLACGLPVMLNYAGWQKSILDEHNAGLGCDIFNDDQFIENLLLLLNSPDLRKQMGKNARKLSEAEFSRDILSQKVFDFILQCFTQSRYR